MGQYINSQNVLDIIAKHYVQAMHEIYELVDVTSESNIGQIERKKIGVETEKGFGFKLLTVCKENGITIKEVSEGTGIPKNTLYNITKRDTKHPQNGIQEKVVNYLETRIPNLTEEEKAQMRWLLLP